MHVKTSLMNVLQQKNHAVLIIFYPYYTLTWVKIVEGFFLRAFAFYILLYRDLLAYQVCSAALGFASCYDDYLSSQNFLVSCDWRNCSACELFCFLMDSWLYESLLWLNFESLLPVLKNSRKEKVLPFPVTFLWRSSLFE